MSDTRHQRRIDLMQDLFACTFRNGDLSACSHPDNKSIIQEILQEIPQIDQQIQEVAPERPLTEINKVDLAILRLIVFESKHKQTPHKVLLDEAIELAKEFGSETSPKFINGALAQLLLGK